MRKNIVLLADGTGNSSASPFKTNVWRLYQAIDIESPTDPDLPPQIVYYDNGVGTENFKPLAALGGAFGIGVWKNVKDLYTFVCRNYEIGDRIYGFGFSRGSFTIRLLMGLIGKCGIVEATPKTESALLEAVEMAYEAYRRDFLLRASRKHHMIYHHILRKPRYEFDDAGWETDMINLIGEPFHEQGPVEVQPHPQIAFVGVWDTVDAYGMPVDELKLAINRWVWPMSFADRTLSKRIDAARHALSLDDERPTFRPVLWTEVPPGEEPVDPARLKQVWFAGVHSNVGGGYPDDSLAYVALDWMMTEAASAKLRFAEGAHDDVRARADVHGKEYDSRSGLAGYYRYGPRNVEALCDDKEHGVLVQNVHVHESVAERLERHQVGYAPVSLNRSYTSDAPLASAMQPDRQQHELAWDLVWWRRLAYFATLALSIFLSLFALRIVCKWANPPLHHVEAGLRWITSGLGRLCGQMIGAVGGWMPHWLQESTVAEFASALRGMIGMVGGWMGAMLASFAVYPRTAVVFGSLLALFFFKISTALQARIEARAEWAWAAQKGLPLEPVPPPTLLNTIARPGRRITGALYLVWREVFVFVFGILLGFAALVLFSPYWITRVFRSRPWMASRGESRTRKPA